ncbi:TatD family deoxyribonuclease [Sporosarcina sp. ANT_H38]|uniref:TatD family hydrolase n=1 Tax=Sporosarcina sp. ANT_H38 TaxID=2597358 RepID=UPI0011F2378F|nr:TatD family hydrolase [Sporosarcina sp. ANT_H38]KAA0966295.1 TatD family deoxyribonuclease [Sporosarcina sp. ANT_H38]
MNYEVDDKIAIIDAHIHLDQYKKSEQRTIIDYLEHPSSALNGIISVSMDLVSSINNMKLAQSHSRIHPAFGYHPEQEPPSDEVLLELFSFMQKNKDQMVAIGEVGLPYYLKEKKPALQLEPYIEALEAFIDKAKTWNKPLVLHAIYEDAETVCDMLEKHSVSKAHFHWFKGAHSTIERMIRNGYYVSVTPDCVYEHEIQMLIKQYPIDRLMVETDGPWFFSGPFENEMTHPTMMHKSILKIASVKKMDYRDVYQHIYDNTKRFYLC